MLVKDLLALIHEHADKRPGELEFEVLIGSRAGGDRYTASAHWEMMGGKLVITTEKRS